MSHSDSWPDAPLPLADGDWQVTLWKISDSGVLSITLNRPERLNALSFRLLRELQALVDFAAARPGYSRGDAARRRRPRVLFG